MNQIQLCTTNQVSSSFLCTETTWFVSTAQQAKLRHRRHSCWSITESVRTATGQSLWVRSSKLHLLTDSLKMMCKCSSFSDLRFFLTLFFCSVRTIWLLNFLQKELSTFLFSRWNLRNSGVWTWSLLQDAILSWWHQILTWCEAMISAARRWAWSYA